MKNYYHIGLFLVDVKDNVVRVLNTMTGDLWKKEGSLWGYDSAANAIIESCKEERKVPSQWSEEAYKMLENYFMREERL